MKAQPLAYNKDNQEDKEPLFDTVDTLADTLAIMTDLVAGGITANAAAHARGGARRLRDGHRPRRLPRAPGRRSATRTRRSRVRCGTRKHRVVGLEDLSLATLRTFAPQAGDDVGSTRSPSKARWRAALTRAARPRPRCAQRLPRRGRAAAAMSAAAAPRRSWRPLRGQHRRASGKRGGTTVSDEAIGLAAASLTTAAYVPQVVRIWKTRSAHDISWWMFGIMTLGALLWLVYGLRLPSRPVAAANALVLVLLAAILVLKWRFGRDRARTLRRAPRRTIDFKGKT